MSEAGSRRPKSRDGDLRRKRCIVENEGDVGRQACAPGGLVQSRQQIGRRVLAADARAARVDQGLFDRFFDEGRIEGRFARYRIGNHQAGA